MALNYSLDRPSGPQTNHGVWLAIVAGLLFSVNRVIAAAPDPMKVQGPLACGECHKLELEVWKATHHFETFNKMHRESKAREIADKLGIARIKNESVCLNCHYTSKLENGKVGVIAGISCESCHGAARDWIDVHNDFGGAGAKKGGESPEHQAQRIAKSVAGGMTRPAETYELVAKCFGCHTVPQEDIVNAGHQAGSEFELVAWLQGEVRHNFLANPKVNTEASLPHRRLLLVVGRILDLEYSLRSLGKATKEGVFATAMRQRVTTALANLREIEQAVGSVALQEILATGRSAELKLNNADALNSVAEKVATLGKRYSKATDPAQLGALDPLLPAPDKLFPSVSSESSVVLLNSRF